MGVTATTAAFVGIISLFVIALALNGASLALAPALQTGAAYASLATFALLAAVHSFTNAEYIIRGERLPSPSGTWFAPPPRTPKSSSRSAEAGPHTLAGRVVRLYIPALVISILVTAAAASCISAWQLLWLLFFSWLTFSYLFPTAAGNARIEAVGAIFSSGRTLLRAIVVEVSTISPAAASAARDHADLLGCLADEAPMARWLGLQVTYGLLRTVAVTVVTAAAALWGIVRGLGVQATLESLCLS
ncbi:hypothetical protein DFJ74DRAFT_707629 [Hyaloraphidium curvatum]|nr:hypothetical protein DFJ74DRAFT_707629 [Hyaloraphidium curvatum]